MRREELLDRYRTTRLLSTELCSPLEAEDYRIQSMPDVSPPWWNLGHTSWFFAKNLLEPNGRKTEDDRRLEYVLNSYYESLGPRLTRAHRGLVTRPTTEEVHAYRQTVDRRVEELVQEAEDGELERIGFLITTGIHHEQQHQELLLSEIKHILGTNVAELREPYAPWEGAGGREPVALEAIPFEGGLHEFGNLEGGWCFDNEMPVHKAYLEDFALSNRLVTNGEYLEFISDGGYAEPLLWLSNGWAAVVAGGWQTPLYWQEIDGSYRLWTLGGDRDLDPAEPVCHLSFYEADAFARWKDETDSGWSGARLPTEREWEHAARGHGFAGENFLENRHFHPRAATASPGELAQTAGDLWEWTSSHYEPYPRYRPFDGALTEYNSKFMDNQRVLRGGSCATPASHIRVSYRNFWPSATRFQFSGLRLARDKAL